MKVIMATVAAGLLMLAGAAQARDVSWRVTVSSPQPVLAPPRVIYTPPPRVVYHPVPVVYERAAPVYYMPPGHAKKWHKHQHKYAYHPGAVYVVKGHSHRHHDDD